MMHGCVLPGAAAVNGESYAKTAFAEYRKRAHVSNHVRPLLCTTEHFSSALLRHYGIAPPAATLT